jgi:hypothetical protein
MLMDGPFDFNNVPTPDFGPGIDAQPTGNTAETQVPWLGHQLIVKVWRENVLHVRRSSQPPSS